jgi:acetolactate synthase I/II/III large subunit
VKSSTLGLYPDGWARSTDTYPLTALEPAPRYEDVVRAFDGHGEQVNRPADVPAALERALRAVRDGRQAVVNVICQRAV